MTTKIDKWSIRDLYSAKDKIQEQPIYQRKEVWKLRKKQLLIDSILREFDMPKIYLRKMNTGMYDFEVADGQQRVTSIFQFLEDKFSLSNDNVNGVDLSKIGSFSVGGKKCSELNIKLIKRLKKYVLTIAIVENATNAEIRSLFGRLQMGDPLIPAEIRNAIISHLGTQIDNMAFNHNFFSNCKISRTRYKHQDYLAHVFALICYKNKEDLKAPLLQRLYFDYSRSISETIVSDAARVLECMHLIDQQSRKRITNKWSFVDIFWVLYNNVKKLKNVDHQKVAEVYDLFETKRLANIREPEKLIKGRNKDVDMYNYIVAFIAHGSSSPNINKRAKVFQKLYKNFY